ADIGLQLVVAIEHLRRHAAELVAVRLPALVLEPELPALDGVVADRRRRPRQRDEITDAQFLLLRRRARGRERRGADRARKRDSIGHGRPPMDALAPAARAC